MNKKIIVLCLISGLGFCQNIFAIDKNELLQNINSEKPQRVISLGGDITEIVYVLQAEQKLVGVDTTSSWPEAASLLPKVGYFRALSAEGILSLSPDLVLISGEAGPPAVIKQLEAINLPMKQVSSEKSITAVVSKIQNVADAINEAEKGSRLIARVKTEFKKLNQLKTQIQTKPRVVFLFSVAKGNLLAAGTKTAADAMIKLAVGENVFSEYSGYKPVNSEVLIAAAPDILLLTDRVLDSLGGIKEVMKYPGVSLTPAGKNKHIVVMDTLYLLGFGPRTVQAALELTYHFHPELRQEILRE